MATLEGMVDTVNKIALHLLEWEPVQMHGCVEAAIAAVHANLEVMKYYLRHFNESYDDLVSLRREVVGTVKT